MRNATRTFSLTGKALELLSAEVRGIHLAAYVLGASALLSSLLALARDRLLAHTFGASLELDLYYAAFRIPDLLFVALGALVSVYVLIPMLSGKSEQAQRSYIDSIVAGFSVFAVIASGALFILAPTLLRYLFPEYVGEEFETLVLLTRILLIQPVLLGFSNIVAAVTQFTHRYTLYAATPIVYNIGIIAGIAFLNPAFGIKGVAWGVVFGALLHLLVQLPSARKSGFFRGLPALFETGAFFTTIRTSLPRALALSMNQLSFLGLLSLASGMTAGSISIFMFAFNLNAVPLAIIGASYSVAAFPTLAASFATGRRGEFLTYVSIAARQILFWSLPALALVIVLRAHIVRSVLGSGAFDWTDTRLTAAALALFVVSLVAQGISLLLIRALYAAGKTLAPLVVSSITAALTLGLGVLFVYMFREGGGADVYVQVLLRAEGVPGSEILPLILAYSAASMIGTLLLIGYFELRIGNFLSEVSLAWWKGIVAACTAAAASYATLHVIGDVTFASTLASIITKGALAGIVGIASAAGAYYILRSVEFEEAARAFRKRVWRDVEPVSSGEGGETSRA